jgi:hypothetical protein
MICCVQSTLGSELICKDVVVCILSSFDIRVNSMAWKTLLHARTSPCCRKTIQGAYESYGSCPTTLLRDRCGYCRCSGDSCDDAMLEWVSELNLSALAGTAFCPGARPASGRSKVISYMILSWSASTMAGPQGLAFTPMLLLAARIRTSGLIPPLSSAAAAKAQKFGSSSSVMALKSASSRSNSTPGGSALRLG